MKKETHPAVLILLAHVTGTATAASCDAGGRAAPTAAEITAAAPAPILRTVATLKRRALRALEENGARRTAVRGGFLVIKGMPQELYGLLCYGPWHLLLQLGAQR